MVWVISLLSPDLSTRRLTPGQHVVAFGVCLGSIGGEALLPNQSLYLYDTNSKAAPKGISGSTSYLSV